MSLAVWLSCARNDSGARLDGERKRHRREQPARRPNPHPISDNLKLKIHAQVNGGQDASNLP